MKNVYVMGVMLLTILLSGAKDQVVEYSPSLLSCEDSLKSESITLSTNDKIAFQGGYFGSTCASLFGLLVPVLSVKPCHYFRFDLCQLFWFK